MSGELKIEKGIPIPTDIGGRPRISVFRQMEVGDSVLVNVTKTKYAGGNYGKIAKELGRKFTARAVEGGVRVWRIA